MRDLDAFLMGIKPAVLLGLESLNLSALKQFPRVIEGNSVMFFQSDEMLRNFKRDIAVQNRHTVLGHYLGFPPNASEWFQKNIKNDLKFEREKVFVDYLGRHFASSIDDLEGNVLWLWENINAPALRRVVTVNKPIKYEIVERRGKKMLKVVSKYTQYIDYDDIKKLHKVAEELKTLTGGDA